MVRGLRFVYGVGTMFEMILSFDKVSAFTLPLVAALALAGFAVPTPRQDLQGVEQNSPPPALVLTSLSVESSAELASVFEQLNYSWPLAPGAGVPALALDALPGDLMDVRDVDKRKALFFRALLPVVLVENQRIMTVRGQIEALFAADRISNEQWQWLGTVAEHYGVYGRLDDPNKRRRLLRRVDMVPPELALAQAANESAWGTSRFARQGNNLFGQWTYRQAEGMIPRNRPEGATYAVRSFPSIDASVRAYLHNLNTNRAYGELRVSREQMRLAGEAPDGVALARGLTAYSARGEAYVAEIQAMIRSNRLRNVLASVVLRLE